MLPLYLPRPWKDFIGGLRNPAMDGELGIVLKTYREIHHGAGDEWFDAMWPQVKMLMTHIMDHYDSAGDGVIRGEQPNTYDISIYGPNTFIGSLYLAALRAAEEMAKLQQEEKLAASDHARFELGRQIYDRLCWNGEYYVQIVDLAEYTEQQFSTGCHMDQLLGQWWAHTLDLRYVLPAEHVRTAIANIFRFNRCEGFRRQDQAPHVYMGERDRGLYICTWPHGGKPEIPTQYSDEVWSGLEYPVAALLLHEGFTEEALTMLADVRRRHDGTRRSPWNEVECGDHYVRPMASWTLLEEATGYHYDAMRGRLGFSPRIAGEPFRFFFITGSGWGTFRQEGTEVSIQIDYGSLQIEELNIPGSSTKVEMSVAGQSVQATVHAEGGEVHIHMQQPMLLTAGDRLQIELGAGE